MRVLLVGPYPPRHCGIGAYVAAQAERLRSKGNAVTVLCPPDGDGDLSAELLGGGAFRRAARIGGRFDRIVVHFQPALYYRPRRPWSKVATSASLLWLVLRRRQAEILVHEADRPRPRWRPDHLLLRRAFARAPLWFHTDAERRVLEEAYGVRVRAEIVPHEEGVAVHARLPRAEARRRRGVPEEEPLYLCAGFLHPSKGFDRAVRAFVRSGSAGRLAIVGSVRDATPENLAHAALLRELCAHGEGVQLVERYVDDEEFDEWMTSADRVVLPYRRSWSSGALARAHALGTPAIVSAVGGLPEQAGPEDVVFSTDEELAVLFARLVGTRA